MRKITPLTNKDMFNKVFNDKDMIPILERFVSDFLDVPYHKVRGNLEILSTYEDEEVKLLLTLDNEKMNIILNMNN